MYSHLMVPVDGTIVSSLNVDAAVRMASLLKARITFFHASKDSATTNEGALFAAMSPLAFADEVGGDTSAVLAKASASAAAAGVPCECVSSQGDHAASAIVDAAVSRGCDLIVMASRGARGLSGWLHGSQTERVLRASPIALLVTRVASNDAPSPAERALAVIQDEHRSIAVVVRAMQGLLRQASDTGTAADLRLLKAMLRYLREFPLVLHHPKEERYLHRLLRERARDAGPLLAELEAQHAREHELVDQAMKCAEQADAGDEVALVELGTRIETLAIAIWGHMTLEESKVLPLAREKLLPGDWLEVAEAFEGNGDPDFAALQTEEFRRYFTRLTNLLPAGPSIA